MDFSFLKENSSVILDVIDNMDFSLLKENSSIILNVIDNMNFLFLKENNSVTLGVAAILILLFLLQLVTIYYSYRYGTLFARKFPRCVIEATWLGVLTALTIFVLALTVRSTFRGYTDDWWLSFIQSFCIFAFADYMIVFIIILFVRVIYILGKLITRTKKKKKKKRQYYKM